VEYYDIEFEDALQKGSEVIKLDLENVEMRMRTLLMSILEHKRTRFLSRLDGKDLVLDVGSGSKPLPRANILCDLSLRYDAERSDRPLKINGKPLIVCDIQHLPFRDKQFAFVNCTAVLEHTKRPSRAIEELRRVAKRGYVTFPTFLCEVMYRQSFHRYVIRRKSGKFVFQPNTLPYCTFFHAASNRIVMWRLIQIAINEMTSVFTTKLFFDDQGFYSA